jgi:putative polyhydroxyalkanoate system protein
MASIDITRNHSLPKADALQMAEDLAKSLESKMGVTWHRDGDSVRFEAASGVAKGVKGELKVSDNQVRVTVDLPMMLRMMKGSIEEKINEKLNALV